MQSTARAVLYCRVSKEEAATKGVTLEAQEQRLRAYCLSRGLEVVALVKDDGVSGAVPFAERPAGAEVRALFLAGACNLKKAQKRGAPSHLVVAKIDRLGRDTADILGVVRELQAAGLAVHTSDEGGEVEDLENGNAELMVTMRAAFASFERRAIASRTKAALAFKKSQGLRVGKIPLGMRLAEDGKHLEPDPVTERAVRLMVENRREEMRVREEIALGDAEAANWEKLVADTSSELDLIAAERAAFGHGPVDDFGEEIEGLEPLLVELDAKARQRLGEARQRLAEARAKLRELRVRRAALVAKKKATSILATVRALNADPVTYPPRGRGPWDPKTVRQALERRS